MKEIKSFVAVLSLFALVVTASVAVASDHGGTAPIISNFTITPSSVSSVPSRVTMEFDYKNVKGGLASAEVSLEYKGSESSGWRKESINQRRFQTRFGWGNATEESGTFSTSVRFRASDDPPFDITYWLKIKDADGRWSNEVSAVLSYTN